MTPGQHHPKEEDLRVLTVGRVPQDTAPNLHHPQIIPFVGETPRVEGRIKLPPQFKFYNFLTRKEKDNVTLSDKDTNKTTVEGDHSYAKYVHIWPATRLYSVLEEDNHRSSSSQCGSGFNYSLNEEASCTSTYQGGVKEERFRRSCESVHKRDTSRCSRLYQPCFHSPENLEVSSH